MRMRTNVCEIMRFVLSETVLIISFGLEITASNTPALRNLLPTCLTFSIHLSVVIERAINADYHLILRNTSLRIISRESYCRVRQAYRVSLLSEIVLSFRFCELLSKHFYN